MLFGQACQTGEALVEALGTACHRIELAGSLRRGLSYLGATGKPYPEAIGDLEFVVIPRYEEREAAGQQGLFDQHVESVSLLWERIESIGRDRLVPISPRSSGKDGRQPEEDRLWHTKRIGGAGYLKVWLPKKSVALDLFIATPATWGYKFTIHTGSAAFSTGLVSRWAQEFQGSCDHARFVRGEQKLDTPEEKDVFRVLQLSWVPPHLRSGYRDVARAGGPGP